MGEGGCEGAGVHKAAVLVEDGFDVAAGGEMPAVGLELVGFGEGVGGVDGGVGDGSRIGGG